MAQPRKGRRHWEVPTEREGGVGSSSAGQRSFVRRSVHQQSRSQSSGARGGPRSAAMALVLALACFAVGTILFVAVVLNYRFVVRVKLLAPDHRRDPSSTIVVDCAYLLRDKQVWKLKSTDPNANLDDALKRLVHVNRFQPSFWMSVHTTSALDGAASRSPVMGEWDLEEIWRGQLQLRSVAPSGQDVAHVLDVGSGLGYYSLAATATAGRGRVQVHAFEANPAHNLRLCESVDANGWLGSTASVRILSTGVSDRVQELPYSQPKPNDPLAAGFDPDFPDDGLDDAHVLKHVITLDSYAASMGWLDREPVAEGARPRDPVTAVIKLLRIDKSESPSRVLRGAELLLRQRIIENVFLTLSAATNAEAADAVVGVSLLLEAGYKLVGYGPADDGPTREVPWRGNDSQLVGHLVEAAQREFSQMLSAWFQYPMKGNTAHFVSSGKRPISSGASPAVPTIHCPRFVSETLRGKLGIDDPNSGMNRTGLRGHVSHEAPPFWISLHNENYDPTRWRIKAQGHYYKTQLERIWRDILRKAPRGAHVLDVGSNVGYFSLLSLSLGEFYVAAFEPNAANFLRLCESLELNRWTAASMKLHPVGVSDSDGVLRFRVDKDNPGASRFYDAAEVEGGVHTTPYQKTPVVSLDSWAERLGWFEMQPPPIVAILKVDVEGMEDRVVAGARRLLQRRMLQNVFLELSARDDAESNRSAHALSDLLNAGYKLVGQGDWQGPGRPVPWAHDEHLVFHVVEAARRTLAKQINVWFQPPS